MTRKILGRVTEAVVHRLEGSQFPKLSGRCSNHQDLVPVLVCLRTVQRQLLIAQMISLVPLLTLAFRTSAPSHRFYQFRSLTIEPPICDFWSGVPSWASGVPWTLRAYPWAMALAREVCWCSWCPSAFLLPRCSERWLPVWDERGKNIESGVEGIPNWWLCWLWGQNTWQQGCYRWDDLPWQWFY